jgi:predicted anti-sigma-YlaC factor YlaD
MNTKHITKILDRANYTELSDEELANIRIHTQKCPKCLQASLAAQISSNLLRSVEVTNAPPVPSPFFQAKVLNAWRETQQIKKPIAAFRRWWQASAALVFSMLLVVGGLVLYTLAARMETSAINQKSPSEYSLYSTESVILNQKTPKDLTTEQAFEIIDDSKLAQKRK